MDKENPQFDLNLERAKQVVSNKVAEVETVQSSDLTRDKWNQAKGNIELPIYTYSQTLFEAGYSEQHVKSLVDLVKDLEIDVSDPYTSGSELSVIAGILSEDLVGIDMSQHRREMDKVKSKQVDIIREEDLAPRPDEVSYVSDERAQYHELAGIKFWQRELIVSNRNYREISQQLLEQNNQALDAVTRGHMQRFWAENNIPEDSEATVFFRDHKTYAGDIDFYYWGPESEKCTFELSRYLMSLGYKVDHRSNILVDELLKSGEPIENGYLSAYLQMYFYMGKSIEFNGDSFEEHYRREVTPVARPEYHWRTSHKSLVPAAEIVGGVYHQNMPEYPGLKDYPFRLLSVTLMGLASKYDVPFTLNYEDLIDSLGGQLSEGDASGLKNSFYYLNQARNIYQLVTERRWEMMTPEIKDDVNRVLQQQGALRIEDEMSLLAGKIKSIADTHFGESKNGDVLDLNEAKDQADTFVTSAYKKVADRYKQIAKLQ